MLMAATCHENNIKISNKINIIKKDESRTKKYKKYIKEYLQYNKN